MADDPNDEGVAPATGVTASLNDMQLYWMALGRFVNHFSLVETLLLMLLVSIAKLEPHVAPALLSGTRIDAAKDFIKRLLEACPNPAIDTAELNEVFARLTLVTRIRNDLLHYGVKVEEVKGLMTSNQLIALTPARLRETQISPEILEDLSADIHKACGHLTFFMAKVEGVDKPSDRAFHQELVATPWRYKPDTPSPPYPPSLPRSPGQSPPP